MAVSLKRSEGVCPPECKYGCCTEMYGKNVKKMRRRARRATERETQRLIAQTSHA